MNQERKEELIVRWMDGEALSTGETAELDAILKADPELKAMKESHAEISEELRMAYKQPEDVPYGDFFQTKLEQAIRDSEQVEAAVPERSVSWRDSLRWWLAPVTVGAMAIAFLAGTRVGKPPVTNRQIVLQEPERPLVFTAEGLVTSTIVNTDADGTSVIVLDGLQPIPDSFELMAVHPESFEQPNDVRLISTESSSQIF